jgi:hypothetical protein
MTRNIKEESKIPITTMEELNQMADAINALWFISESALLKDISHWNRDLYHILDAHTKIWTIPYYMREDMKIIADVFDIHWHTDEAVLLKDISHRFRYSEINPNKRLSFYEFVKWKYEEGNWYTQRKN